MYTICYKVSIVHVSAHLYWFSSMSSSPLVWFLVHVFFLPISSDFCLCFLSISLDLLSLFSFHLFWFVFHVFSHLFWFCLGFVPIYPNLLSIWFLPSLLICLLISVFYWHLVWFVCSPPGTSWRVRWTTSTLLVTTCPKWNWNLRWFL